MALSDLQRVIRENRAALIRGDRGAALDMVRHYNTALAGIDRELHTLRERMEEAQEAGEKLSPNWAFRQSRLANIRAQAVAQIDRFTDSAEGIIRNQQSRAAQQAQEDVRAAVFAQANPPTPKAGIALENAWQTLPAGAVEDLAGALGNGSPLRTLLQQIPGQVADRMEETLVEGLAMGRSPRVIASQMHDATGVGLSRSLLIARTETMRAYRESTARTLEENSDVLMGWVWHAETGGCCVACYVMHGTLHPPEETLESHPGCRCAMVPRTKDWADIGAEVGIDLSDVPPSGVDVPLGEEMFDAEPLSRKIELLGVQGVDDWMRGMVKPIDFLAVKTSKAWGTIRTARTPAQAAWAAQERMEREAAAQKAREARIKARAGVKAKRTIKPGQGETWALDAAETLNYLRTLDAELKAAISAANDAKYAAQDRALKAGEKFGNLNHRLHNLGEKLTPEEMLLLESRREVMDAHHLAIDKAEKQWRKLAQGRKKRLREALYAPPAERAQVDYTIRNAKGDRLKEIEKGLDEFGKLVATRDLDGKRVWVEDKSTQRAFYRRGEVHLDKQSGADVVVHELGHWLEDSSPAMLQKLVDFRNSRIKPGEQLKPYRPNAPTELAFHDDWAEPYTGKVYQSGGRDYATEVASMGLQEMYKDPIAFADSEPEFFRFTLDTVMRGR